MIKTKRKFRRKVMKCHDKWKELLALSWWKSKVVFFDNMTNTDGTSPLAECSSNWQYQDYVISINEYELRKKDKAMIDRVILHELLHVVVQEMKEDSLKHEERVVTQLQYAITNMMRASNPHLSDATDGIKPRPYPRLSDATDWR